MKNSIPASRWEPLLALREVASLLRVSEMTIYRLVDRRTLGVVRVARTLRFRAADIAAFMGLGPDPYGTALH